MLTIIKENSGAIIMAMAMLVLVGGFIAAVIGTYLKSRGK
jgi:hypothetical protein